MTTYKQGDVLLVPYPFTDQSGTKQRPAVVLSGAAYNRSHPDLILAPITSQIAHAQDEVILSDWETVGLLKPSSVKPLLSSLETGLVRRKLGKLPPSDIGQIRALFTRIFELK
jgi:mRNA interferase MazF